MVAINNDDETPLTVSLKSNFFLGWKYPSRGLFGSIALAYRQNMYVEGANKKIIFSYIFNRQIAYKILYQQAIKLEINFYPEKHIEKFKNSQIWMS